MKKYITLFMIVFLVACSSSNTAYPSASIETPAPTIDEVKQPVASGTKVATDNELVQIDYSNVNDGYFQVKTVSDDHRGLIVLVVKDDQQYRYDINDDYIYETFPINMGSGEYKVKVGENIEDNRYAIILTVSFSVTLVDDVIPFLYPNQVIDFDIDSNAVSLSFGLTEDAKSQLERVYVIYHYIIDNIDYDFGKLEAARSSYILPIIDETLASKKGICFDYASLMSAMLRVQQIPTKVITGYVDDGYHSWVEVYIDGEGWINPQIYFNSQEWKLIDPTYGAAKYNYKGTYEEVYEY